VIVENRPVRHPLVCARYIGGILIGWLYAKAIVRSERLWGGPAPITSQDFDDFVLW